jgi:hypothetical protein
MTSKLKTDVLETVSGSGTIALTNQLSGMTTASLPALTAAEMPAGSVINTYHQQLGDNHIVTTSSSFVATGLSITLTPVSSSSKFYISYSHAPHQNTSGYQYFGQHHLYRNSTQTLTGGGFRQDAGSGWMTNTSTVTGVDSPATTSAITYTVKMNSGNGNHAYFHSGNHHNGNDAIGTNVFFTIMEIAG